MPSKGYLRMTRDEITTCLLNPSRPDVVANLLNRNVETVRATRRLDTKRARAVYASLYPLKRRTKGGR